MSAAGEIELSVATTQPRAPVVAFQGELGAYGDEAIENYWKGLATPAPMRTFSDVLTAVSSGAAHFGVLPVWNSVIGLVQPSCDALFDARRSTLGAPAVIGEVTILVRHFILALPGTALDDVRHVGSHPAALAQCSRFFREHPRIEARDAYDTAGAARQLAACAANGDGVLAQRADSGDGWAAGIDGVTPRSLGVIASAGAARRYGLQVLAEDVQDMPDNVTQFFILTRAHPSNRSAAPEEA